MRTIIQAATVALFATLGAGTSASAATVASVDVPFLQFGGIIYEIEQAGSYTLDFSGTGSIQGFPEYLGFAAYIYAEVDGGLDELIETLAGGIGLSAFDGTSVDLGFLASGVDFAAGLASLGNVRMSLNRVDDAPAPIPLPATLPLLAAAIGAAGLVGRRRNG
ncbi:hypothetical protein EYE42_08460 [Paracoccus subflavus]|uniref:VPLPA-CTERM sorting domain-containing protein n=1 Tax=Paracoccus subflavus TaxID=2528244 RepID=A0A4Q9G0E7_9RHOB|nr:hypothetical protein [Paracoccus subflavus]TBN40419.1 hypothetical protein EYE42_08460 [Paracoccus subflavus]